MQIKGEFIFEISILFIVLKVLRNRWSYAHVDKVMTTMFDSYNNNNNKVYFINISSKYTDTIEFETSIVQVEKWQEEA